MPGTRCWGNCWQTSSGGMHHGITLTHERSMGLNIDVDLARIQMARGGVGVNSIYQLSP